MKKLFLFVGLFLLPTLCFANEARIESQKSNVHLGEDFIVNIVVSSKDKINAIEGDLMFDRSLVSVKKIIDGDSVINFWVKSPEDTGEKVVFSGVTPVGFSGQSEKIFSVILNAKKAGSLSIYLNNFSAYLSDGTGNKINMDLVPVSIPIESVVLKTEENVEDSDSPEDFTPKIILDNRINNGRKSLVFATQDKMSGIDSYYVREGRIGFYKKAVSPYNLNNQSLSSNIYIKVKDREGNNRVVVFPSENMSIIKNYALDYFSVIILIIAITTILYIYFKKNRS